MAERQPRVLADQLADAPGSADPRAVLDRVRQEAREHPTAVLPYLDVLVDLLNEPKPAVRVGAAHVLEAVCEGVADLDDPEAVLGTVLDDDDLEAAATPYVEAMTARFLEETERPAVRVASAEAIAALSEVVPGAVSGLVTELLDVAVPRTTPGDLRVPALRAVRSVAEDDPEALLDNRVRVTGLLGDRDPTVRNLAITTATLIADEDPAANLGPHVDRLVAIAATDDPAANRSAAASALARIAEDDPDRLRPKTGELVALLSDEQPGVVRSAAYAVLGVAREDPRAVADHLERVVALRDARDAEIRSVAAETAGVVAAALPTATREVLDDALEDFPNGPERARRSAALVLYYLAEEDPAALWNRIGAARSGLRSADPYVRRGAVMALARIGEEHPDAVPDYASAYVPLLDDEFARTRAGAADALTAAALAGGDVDTAATDVAALLDDDDAGVRAAAARALLAIGLHNPDAVAPARVELDDVVGPVDCAELPDGTPIEQGIAALRDVTV